MKDRKINFRREMNKRFETSRRERRTGKAERQRAKRRERRERAMLPASLMSDSSVRGTLDKKQSLRGGNNACQRAPRSISGSTAPCERLSTPERRIPSFVRSEVNQHLQHIPFYCFSSLTFEPQSRIPIRQLRPQGGANSHLFSTTGKLAALSVCTPQEP